MGAAWRGNFWPGCGVAVQVVASRMRSTLAEFVPGSATSWIEWFGLSSMDADGSSTILYALFQTVVKGSWFFAVFAMFPFYLFFIVELAGYVVLLLTGTFFHLHGDAPRQA